jgi:hypothetical protein
VLVHHLEGVLSRVRNQVGQEIVRSPARDEVTDGVAEEGGWEEPREQHRGGNTASWRTRPSATDVRNEGGDELEDVERSAAILGVELVEQRPEAINGVPKQVQNSEKPAFVERSDFHVGYKKKDWEQPDGHAQANVGV